MAIELEEVVDAPQSTRERVSIDLEPFRKKLALILVEPEKTKAIPVKVGQGRGEGLSSIRKYFNDALDSMTPTKQYDPKKVKLSFRNATPGKTPERVYVKWSVLVPEETASENGAVKS